MLKHTQLCSVNERGLFSRSRNVFTTIHYITGKLKTVLLIHLKENTTENRDLLRQNVDPSTNVLSSQEELSNQKTAQKTYRSRNHRAYLLASHSGHHKEDYEVQR